MSRWAAAGLFVVIGILAGLALWRWGIAAVSLGLGGAVGLGLGAAPVRRRVSRVLIQREIEAAQREEELHRKAEHFVEQEAIAENHARAKLEARARKLAAQARLREIEPKIKAEIGRGKR